MLERIDDPLWLLHSVPSEIPWESIHLRRELLVHPEHNHSIQAHTPKMESETKPDTQPVEAQEQTKRERPASPAAAEPNEEDAMNDSNPTKKPKFEKKSKKDYKPKSPYPGRGKNYQDRPQLSEEERKAKAEERERLRVERRIADEERLENRDEGDRRLPKRRCALLMG
jgi:hypothetical protein